jgi:hypothetical protein
VSRENVDFVMALQPAAGADLTKLFRDDATWAASVARLALVVHPDFVSAWVRPDGEKTYRGLDGLRACFLDSLSSWATYRADVADAIDLGDSVLVLYSDSARRPEATEEIDVNPAGLYTVSDRKLTRWVSYACAAQALKAVGLEE